MTDGGERSEARVMAAERVSEPHIVPCRYCGEAVAVRMASGRLRALGEYDLTSDGAVVIVCPACQRHTRVRRTRIAVDRTRDQPRQ